MPTTSLQKLKEAVAPTHDLGDLNDLAQVMTKGSNRQRVYDELSHSYNMGNFEDFEKSILRDDSVQKLLRTDNAIVNMSRALYKSLVPGTTSAYNELFGDHQKALDISERSELLYPTNPGTSEFLGNVTGSILPTALAMIPGPQQPVLVPLVLANYGLQAAGQGRGAVKAFEEETGEDVGDIHEALVATGYGAAVFAAERIGLGVMDDAIKSFGREALEEIALAYSTKSAAKTSKAIMGALKNVGKSSQVTGAIEGGEEGLEQLITNAIDMTYDPDARTLSSLSKGVGHSAAAGYVGGAALGLIGSSGKVLSQREAVQEEVRTIERYQDTSEQAPDQSERMWAASTKISKAHKAALENKGVGEIPESLIEDLTESETDEAIKTYIKTYEEVEIPRLVRNYTNQTIHTYINEAFGAKSIKELNKGQMEQTIDFLDGKHDPPMKGFEDMIAENEQTRGIARDMLRGAIDKVDVEEAYKRIGADKTGLAVKLYASRIQAEQEEAVAIGARIFKALRGGTKRLGGLFRTGTTPMSQVKEDLQNLPLYLEQPSLMTPDEQVRLQPAIDIWSQYMDEKFNRYQELGGLEQKFQERVIKDLKDELVREESKGKRDHQKIQDLTRSIGLMNEMIFTPMPIIWFEQLMRTNPKKARRVLSVLAAKKRKTIFISDLMDAKENGKPILDKEDIHLADILSAYSNKAGRDFALLEIVKAAEEDGLAIRSKDPQGKRTKEIPEYYHQAELRTPILKGYYLENTLHDFLDDLTVRMKSPGVIQKGLTITKMSQFINPAFLPMYDTIQGIMLGTFSNPLKTFKYAWDAVRSIATRDAAYQDAIKYGLRSTPYANPLTSQQEIVKAATQERFGEWQKIVKDIFLGFATPKGWISGKWLKGIYNLSWKSAWTGDAIIRLMSYHYLRDANNRVTRRALSKLGLVSEVEDFTPQEAAQQAALYHGDYAGVPHRTRRILNTMFFTPTFKIAMSKMFINMFKSLGQVINPLVETPKHAVDNTMALMRMFGLLAGIDALMLLLGWDRDQFGRRYAKKVDSAEGPREITVTWSAPHNMFQKYYFRFRDSFGPETDNKLLRFLNSNKWEIHPVYRVFLEIANNQGMSGKKIVSPFEPSIQYGQIPIKEAKQAWYLVHSLIPLFRVLKDDIEDPEARKVLADELNAGIAQMSRPFTFTYLRLPRDLKAIYDAQRVTDLLHDDIRNMVKEMDSGTPSHVVEERIQRRIETWERRYNAIMEAWTPEQMYDNQDFIPE